MQILRLTLRGTTYEFSEETSDNRELITLERTLGMPTGKVLEQLNEGSVEALTGVLWLCMRRDQPDLKPDDVSFRGSELTVEILDDSEGKAEPPSSES